jgi:hypothetical protein
MYFHAFLFASPWKVLWIVSGRRKLSWGVHAGQVVVEACERAEEDPLGHACDGTARHTEP